VGECRSSLVAGGEGMRLDLDTFGAGKAKRRRGGICDDGGTTEEQRGYTGKTSEDDCAYKSHVLASIVCVRFRVVYSM